MWVPSYSPKDFLATYGDALDWRRMLVGFVLFFWMQFGIGLALEQLGPLDQAGPELLALFDQGLSGLSESFNDRTSIGAKAAQAGAIMAGFLTLAMFLIYPLMRGGATEICQGKRSSFPELIAFTKVHTLRMIALQAFGMLLSLGVLLPLAWSIRHWGESGRLVTIIICLPLAIPVFLFLTIQPILFPAHAVSGGGAYEALSRSVIYFLKAPANYGVNMGFKALGLGVLILATIGLFDVLPAWLAWMLGAPLIGFAASYGAASDVLVYVKQRHAADGSPYVLCIDAEKEVVERASAMEQDVAIKRRFPNNDSQSES